MDFQHRGRDGVRAAATADKADMGTRGDRAQMFHGKDLGVGLAVLLSSV